MAAYCPGPGLDNHPPGYLRIDVGLSRPGAPPALLERGGDHALGVRALRPGRRLQGVPERRRRRALRRRIRPRGPRSAPAASRNVEPVAAAAVSTPAALSRYLT